jgi:hypothetical protein
MLGYVAKGTKKKLVCSNIRKQVPAFIVTDQRGDNEKKLKSRAVNEIGKINFVIAEQYSNVSSQEMFLESMMVTLECLRKGHDYTRSSKGVRSSTQYIAVSNTTSIEYYKIR